MASLLLPAIFADLEAARQSEPHYIEMFYNPTRRHQTLAWISPIEFEADYHNRLTNSAETTQKETTQKETTQKETTQKETTTTAV